MKKLILLFTCLITLIAVSQAQNSFGFQAGATFAKQKYSGEGIDISLKTKVGLTVGVVGSLAISDNFAFRPELNFTQKGAKASSDDGGGSLNLNYIELPLNFVYQPGGQHNGFFIGAGPSVAFGISGKSKADGEEDEKIKFGSGDDADLKAVDFGANMIAGYQLKSGVFISANYNLGLSNLLPGSDNGDYKIRNNYFGVKIGFMLK